MNLTSPCPGSSNGTTLASTRPKPAPASSSRFVSSSNDAKNIGAPSQSASTSSWAFAVPIVASSVPPGRNHPAIRRKSGACSSRGTWPSMNSETTPSHDPGSSSKRFASASSNCASGSARRARSSCARERSTPR
jgi:hypothetical protein